MVLREFRVYLEYQEYLAFLVDLRFQDNQYKMVVKDMWAELDMLLADLVFDKMVYLGFLVDLAILECLVVLDFLGMKNPDNPVSLV